MTPAQCRAARALLDVTQPELATMAELGLSTVVDFERERRVVSKEAVAAMQNALEQAGVSFRAGGVEMTFVAGLAAPTDVFAEQVHLGKLGQPALTSAQIRAGRALLGWSVADLARATALGVNTIRRAELSEGQTALTLANGLAIRRALEAAGVVFIEENGGGPGVRLRKRQPQRASRP